MHYVHIGALLHRAVKSICKQPQNYDTDISAVT